MNVPFLDVGAGYRELQTELTAAYERVMTSGRYILGEEVEAFEREFAGVAGTGHAVGVGNGLDGLAIALRVHDVGPGDEVIVPAHTFIATWLAITQCGATVVPVDVEPSTLLIDTDAAAAAVTSRTVAIVPVHLYGHPTDMRAIGALAERHGLLVVEDAAQAHGAEFGQRAVGSLGDVAAFSFYPVKNLGAFGDGGALTTDDGAVAARARRLRNYGSTDRDHHEERGVNSRLDPLQAAFLRVKLTALSRWNRRRRGIAATYQERLAGVEELILPPPGGAGIEPAWHQFCVRHPRRDDLRAQLAADGIATLIHYPIPPHRSKAFADLGFGPGSFPVTEKAAETVLSLPIGPHLDDASVEAVIRAVRGYASSST